MAQFVLYIVYMHESTTSGIPQGACGLCLKACHADVVWLTHHRCIKQPMPSVCLLRTAIIKAGFTATKLHITSTELSISNLVVCLSLAHMHYKHKPPHIHRHLFAMLMSCDGDRTSVAARPRWDRKGCHANPSPTPSLSLGHIQQLSVCVSTQTHTLTNLCCLCDMHFIMLFFWLALCFFHLHCVLQMTLCCWNNEQLRFPPIICRSPVDWDGFILQSFLFTFLPAVTPNTSLSFLLLYFINLKENVCVVLLLVKLFQLIGNSLIYLY